MRTLAIVITTIILTIVAEIALVVGYVYIKNPFNIRGVMTPPAQDSTATSTEQFDHPLIPNEQEEQLKKAGINVQAFPTEITPQMTACVTEKLGSQRVAELLGGSEPTITDAIKAQSCLSVQ